MNSHIQNGTWREKPTSVFYQQKVGQCKAEVILGIQYANIVGWECHGLLWEVKPGNFGPNKSPFIRTFSHMPFFEMRFHHGMRLPSLLNIVQALTKAPRISHTYSLRSHTARRSIDEDAYFCFLFFSFFSLAHWNAIVCVFWTLSGENSTFPIFQRIHIPEFLTTNAKKIARRVWGRKLYASFVYDSDGDTRLLPWSAKESKYARLLALPMC